MEETEQESVEVAVSIPVEDGGENQVEDTDVEKEHLIDAAVTSGVAAGAATDAAATAQEQAYRAEDSARMAENAAAVAGGNADRTEQLLAAVEAQTASTAALVAALTAKEANQEAGSILENEQLNPELDIEPEPQHFLQRKWFSKK